LGGERVRRHHPIFWCGESGDKKINNIKYIVAFGGHWLIILHTTTYLKWAGAGMRGWRRGMNMREWQRDVNAPRLHVEDKRGQRTALSTIAGC
jgi:hypothetical protein